MSSPAESNSVLTANGLKGTTAGTADGPRAGGGLVCVTLEDGRRVWVAPHMLIPQPEGHYLLPLSLPDEASERTETVVVPVVEEEAVVGKREVPAGGVRVRKVVHERDEVVDTVAVQEELDVQREVVERFVEQPEPARQDGDRTIIPIYEEVVVVEKRLRLKERWVITRRRTEVPGSQKVQLRREEVVLDRLDPAQGPSAEPSGT
jgi:stress response protein YsnF